MRSLQRFLKYYAPLFVLPLIHNFFSNLTNTFFGRYGTSIIAGRSQFIISVSPFMTLLSCIAFATLAVSAILTERGKLKIAKRVHLIALLVYAGILLIMMIFNIFGWGIPHHSLALESYSYYHLFARIFAVLLLILSPIAALPAQFSGKHSFIFTIALCAGVIVSCELLCMILLMIGVSLPVAITADELSYFAAQIAPFLMIPVKRYSESLAPTVDLRKV